MKWLLNAVAILVCNVVAYGADPCSGTFAEEAIKNAAARQETAANELGMPVDISNSIGLKLRLIPAGEFTMGSSKSPEELMRVYNLPKPIFERYFRDMQPQHRVRITEPFYLGQTEVTQGQWESVMGTRPWEGKSFCKEGSELPASFVSWEDAAEFCSKLSRVEGDTYRLPTEAEWEYACRADTTTSYSFGDDWSELGDYAWFDDNADSVRERYAHEVRKKLPNGFGLHDMHGNMWEWCLDWYGQYDPAGKSAENPSGPPSGPYRVMRGGSWNNLGCFCRSSFRFRAPPTLRRSNPGFRVVKQIR